jgi:hypothetical protein
MNPKILITVAFILAANLIYSQPDADYKYVTTSVDGDEYFVYIEQVANNGSKEFWLKINTPLKDLKGKKRKDGGQTALFLVRMECSTREYDNLELIIYDKKGKVYSSKKDVSFDNRVVPGSTMNGVYDYVCGK